MINLTIDWIKDKSYIYNQVCNLVMERLYMLGLNMGLWKKREFVNFCMKQCGSDIEILEFLDDEFRNDREIVMESVKESAGNLYYATAEMKNDFEIVKRAMKHYNSNLSHASEELKNNREIVMEAVSCGGNLKFAKHFQNDYEIVKAAVQNDGNSLTWASESLRDNKEIVLIALDSYRYASSLASTHLRNDREISLKSISLWNEKPYVNSNTCSFDMRYDRRLIIEAIPHNPMAFLNASDDMKNDREFVKLIISLNESCFRFASKELKDDLEIVELALKSYPDAIHDISDRLRDDTEFISKLIGKRGFKKLPKEFSNDREIVLESIKLDPKNLTKASIELQNDRDFILHVVKNCGMALECVKQEFKLDREIIMEAITENANAMQHILDLAEIMKATEPEIPHYISSFSDQLMNDREIILCLAKHNGLQFLPRKYLLDREILFEGLKTAHPQTAIETAYQGIVNDRVLVMKIVKRDGKMLGKLPSKYKNDREIVSFAIQQNRIAFKFVADELKNDLQILELLNSL